MVPEQRGAALPAHERARDHALGHLGDGPRRHAIAGPVAVLPEDQFYPSYSPDMTKLAVRDDRARRGGRSIAGDGRRHRRRDDAVRLQRRASYDSAPAWSPDGRRIAFESDLDGDMEIFVMNADGSNVRQITHNTLWDEGPAWSPDGTKFAFSRGADDLHLDIWTMNADGSDPRQLTTYPGRDESPDWGVNPAPGGGRRDRPGDALAAARRRGEPRHVPARRRAPTTRRRRPPPSPAPPATRP